jgi:hypothetical protein
MNIKCSAGTGSLMDTLKALFGITDIKQACRLAYKRTELMKLTPLARSF